MECFYFYSFILSISLYKMLITVGDAKARTITNNVSVNPRFATDIIPKNSGQAKMHTKQSVIIAINKNVVIALNGLQSLYSIAIPVNVNTIVDIVETIIKLSEIESFTI